MKMNKSAFMMLMELALLIGGGEGSRGHRRNIMNSNSRFVGVTAGVHTGYRFMCVQNFADDYTDK